jgi:hypothetical protein
MKAAILLLASTLAVAQSPTKKSDKSSLPPDFRVAAVDALACLDSLKENILAAPSTYNPQKARCDELVSKVELLHPRTDEERAVYGPLGTMQLQLNLCRTYARSKKTSEFSKCLAEAGQSRTETADALDGRPKATAKDVGSGK